MRNNSNKIESPSLYKRKIIINLDKDPHGWIQWKGTSVCMDIWCKCGYHGHIDSDFVYYVECPKCGAIYECNGHIELIPLDFKPDSYVHKIT